MSIRNDGAMAPEEADDRVRRVELLISSILRIGVSISFVVIVLGLVITFIGDPTLLSSPDALRRLTSPGAPFPHTLPDVAAGLALLHGDAVIMLGLLLLVATPVIRVAVSIMAFVYQKDRVFVIITAVVLALLLLSFILGKAEG